ncbi:uncharacterized protein ACWYII_023163 [Salvelinus alpinus]
MMANGFFMVLFVLSTCWGEYSPNQTKHSENGTTGTDETTDGIKLELLGFIRLSITCLGLSTMLILSYAVITLLHKWKIHRTMSQQDVVEHQAEVPGMRERTVGRGHRSYKEKINSIYMCMPDK